MRLWYCFIAVSAGYWVAVATSCPHHSQHDVWVLEEGAALRQSSAAHQDGSALQWRARVERVLQECSTGPAEARLWRRTQWVWDQMRKWHVWLHHELVFRDLYSCSKCFLCMILILLKLFVWTECLLWNKTSQDCKKNTHYNFPSDKTIWVTVPQGWRRAGRSPPPPPKTFSTAHERQRLPLGEPLPGGGHRRRDDWWNVVD